MRKRILVTVEVFASRDWLDDHGAFVDGARDVVWDYIEDKVQELETDDFAANVVGVEVKR